MGEVESLLLVLALIYIGECFIWVRRGGLGFGSWWGRTFHILHPGALPGNQRGGLFPANPLPPLGAVYFSQLIPMSLSPDRAYSYSSASLDHAVRPVQTPRCLPYEAILDVEVRGRKVLVNGEAFFAAISGVSAGHWASRLNLLRKLSLPARHKEIKGFLCADLDVEKASRQVQDARPLTRPVRILSNTLFIYLFLVVVPLVSRFGFGLFGLWLLAGMLVQTVSIAFLFRRAHLALFPESGDERLKAFLTMLLAPPVAIRAPDLLALHLLEKSHPLAAAKVLCRPRTFQNLARRVLLDLRYPFLPVCPTTDAAAVAAEEWFRAAALETIEGFVQRMGFPPKDLTGPPARADQTNQSYCPRCDAQFVIASGNCPDCGGRALHRFNPLAPD